MIDPPKRTGYRLTYYAECLYNDWQEIGGCSCHTGCAPCGACTHEGHPISLEENDEAWELDYTIADVYNAWKLKQETEMSRSCITDKGSGVQPPKPTSEWFGFKYRVTPETSKLLQGAVFKDGGWWAHSKEFMDLKYDNYWLFVTSDGKLSWSTTDVKGLPEKQPPQTTSKEFIVGKYYKCIDNVLKEETLTKGKYYRLDAMRDGNFWTDSEDGLREGVRFFKVSRFDINSESDYDPNTAQPAGYTAYVVFKQESTGFGRNTYNGKEYAYKCSRDDYMQWLGLVGLTFDEDVFAEVNVSGVEKKVKVLRIEAKVDPKATKSIVRVLPKELAKDVETSRIQTVVKVSINRDDLLQHKHIGNNATTNVGDVNIMSNQNRVVSVKFFDDDAGLKAEHSLVAEYQVTTRVSDQMTISKVLLTEDVAGDIAAHNKVRAATVDLNILKNTGNKVFLMPVEFEDLRVEVRQV